MGPTTGCSICYHRAVSRVRPLLVPARTQGRAVNLRFDEALVEARPSDTLASALIAAGVLMTSRSPKYRRPRGPSCLSGDCGTCLVRVDGRPNVRACMIPVREGMRVTAQNSYQPKRLDPTALVDTIFPGGIDHHHLMVRPRIANQVMQELARNLTGFGELPEGIDERACEHLDHELPVVVLGAGPAGRAASRALEAAGVDHLLLDRHARVHLEADRRASADAAHELPTRLLTHAGAFGLYPGPLARLEGPGEPLDRALLAVSERPGVSEGHGDVERLHTLRPLHLILATGSRDSMLPFPNNDLPGVVSARGLLASLRRSDALLAGRCVVVGDGERAETLRAALDQLRSSAAPKVARISPADVERAVGSDRVEALICRGERISCALVALAGPPTAAHDLAGQAGLRIDFDGEGFVVPSDGEHGGHCGVLGGTQLWAAGDLCGWLGEAAGPDGAAVAERVIAALATGPEDHGESRRYAPVDPPAPPPLRERAVVGDAFADEDLEP